MRVVILGAGYAGTSIANILDKDPNIDLTVVDTREAQVAKMGGVRAAVNPEWQDKVLVPRSKLLKNGKFVQGSVTQVGENHVTLDNLKELPFDFLVAATGSVSASMCEPPLKYKTISDMKSFYQKQFDAVRAAKSIVVVGGGVVGIELAGEIKEAFPGTKITIVHSGEALMNSNSKPPNKNMRKVLAKKLDSLGIDYILRDRALVDFGKEAFRVTENGTIGLKSGEKVPADLVLNCIGVRMDSSMYPADWLNELGEIKVDDTFLVKGTSNVLAIGDVCDFKEKEGYLATGTHAPKAAANIKALMKGKKPTKRYDGSAAPAKIVSLGSKAGVLGTPMGNLGSFLAVRMKGRKLFTDQSFVNNGLKAPSYQSSKK